MELTTQVVTEESGPCLIMERMDTYTSIVEVPLHWGASILALTSLIHMNIIYTLDEFMLSKRLLDVLFYLIFYLGGTDKGI